MTYRNTPQKYRENKGQKRRGPRQVVIPENPTEQEYEELLDRAVYTCLWHVSQGDKTEQQLIDKLKAKSFTEEYIDAALERVRELDMVNDEEYAQRYTEEKLEAGIGLARINRDLLIKGISREIIETVHEESRNLNPDLENQNALNLAIKKARTYPIHLEQHKRFQRLVGVLSRQGYRDDVYGIARRALEEVDQERSNS